MTNNFIEVQLAIPPWREVFWSHVASEHHWKRPTPPPAARRCCCMDTYVLSLQDATYLPRFTPPSHRHLRVFSFPASHLPREATHLQPFLTFSSLLPYSDASEGNATGQHSFKSSRSLASLLGLLMQVVPGGSYQKHFTFFTLISRTMWKSWGGFKQKAFLHPLQPSSQGIYKK